MDREVQGFITHLGDYAKRVVTQLHPYLESILYYPHPFGVGGIIFVFKDDAEPFLDMVSEVYNCANMSISVHCLKRAELFKLSLPGLFSLPSVTSEHLHLGYWLKHRGVVLFGADVRDEIAPLSNPHLLLNVHIEAAQHSVRAYFILLYLVNKKYMLLVEELGHQVRYLMATALLARGVWDVSFDTIPDLFYSHYGDHEINEIWRQLASLGETDPNSESACRQAGYEAAWLFESFLRRLRAYAL